MASPAVVFVMLFGTGLGRSGIEELRSSAQQSLGPNTEVRVDIVEGSEKLPPQTAGAVVRLSFGPDAEHVRLGCYLPRLRRWVERDLRFDPNDPDTERGRTLGFLVASILVEKEARPQSAPVLQPEAREPAPADPSTMSVSAGLEAAGPGAGTGFGAYVGLELGLRPWLGFGAGGHARFGDVPEAQASTRLLAFGPELTLRPLHYGRAWVGVRANVTMSYLWVSHLSDDDERPDNQVRWLPGAELSAHGAFQLAPAAAIFLDVGATGLLGETELEVRHRVVAVWPSLSGLVRVGIRAAF